jgi:hypothetical protein
MNPNFEAAKIHPAGGGSARQGLRTGAESLSPQSRPLSNETEQSEEGSRGIGHACGKENNAAYGRPRRQCRWRVALNFRRSSVRRSSLEHITAIGDSERGAGFCSSTSSVQPFCLRLRWLASFCYCAKGFYSHSIPGHPLAFGGWDPTVPIKNT